MTKNKRHVKSYIAAKMCEYQVDKLYRETEDKSKVRDY